MQDNKREKKRTNAKEIRKDKIKEKFSGLSLLAKGANPVKKKEKKKEKLKSGRASEKERQR